ncbi:phosphotransferase [Myceligenerans pegani]|uniref:Phosphotransferase n=1 Tax=Myceligenerans pegani TaxID=2776917 RepID=A0ABR9N315_9MICO|nr:phosphotransferase [Myceligenerans sp. TRM 65318]MBE1878044.1 phosphotransferase [Myceligenerans sp. TRM 65318]MBE3020315.1 phosphotransferase [Myceligenerans sp. TRM 65318]
MRDVTEILAEAGLPTAVAKPLDGGFSNETYRVSGGPVEAVLRLNGHQNDALGLSRTAEAAAVRAAAARGIAPRVLAAGADHLLTELVPGPLLTPEQCHEPRYLRAMAHVLAEVHAIEGVDRRCDPFWLVRTYLDGARKLGVPMPDGLDGVLHEVDVIEARAEARGDGMAYCHNDFYRFNVIADDGRLTLLDWELSGVGNVYFDLATPAFHEGCTPEEEHVLIEAYFGEYDDQHAAALHDFKYLNMVREVGWALLHAGLDAARPDVEHVNHSLDYAESARWFLGRILAGHVTARDA